MAAWDGLRARVQDIDGAVVADSQIFEQKTLEATNRIMSDLVESAQSKAIRVVAAVFVCGLLVLLKANKVSHRTHVVEAAWCKRHDKAQRGDEVKIGLVAASRIEDVDHISAGAAEQQFVVGRHAIPALNTALLGMCVGEVRKASLYWDGKPGLQYQVRLLQRLVCICQNQTAFGSNLASSALSATH